MVAARVRARNRAAGIAAEAVGYQPFAADRFVPAAADVTTEYQMSASLTTGPRYHARAFCLPEVDDGLGRDEAPQCGSGVELGIAPGACSHRGSERFAALQGAQQTVLAGV